VNQQRLVIDVPARTVLKVLAIALAVLAFVQILGAVRGVLIWLAVAAFLAVALTPAVRFLRRWLRHSAAVLVVFLGLVGLIAAIAALLVIPIASQGDELVAEAPTYIDKLNHNATIRDLDKRYHILERAQSQVSRAPSAAFGVLGSVVNGVVATITVLFLTLFLMLEMPSISSFLLSLMKPEAAERTRVLAEEINRTVGGYVIGNLIISLIAGTVTAVSLYLLDIPSWLALGVVMAIFDLIPLVGATIGAIIVVGVALAAGGVGDGVVMIVVNVVYQQVENHLLQPIVYRRTVQLSSFVVLVAVLIGGALLGVLGALVAIPVAGSIQLLVRHWLNGWVGFRGEEHEPSLLVEPPASP
jgi:predicted PurR-regulated permease PerM